MIHAATSTTCAKRPSSRARRSRARRRTTELTASDAPKRVAIRSARSRNRLQSACAAPPANDAVASASANRTRTGTRWRPMLRQARTSQSTSTPSAGCSAAHSRAHVSAAASSASICRSEGGLSAIDTAGEGSPAVTNPAHSPSRASSFLRATARASPTVITGYCRRFRTRHSVRRDAHRREPSHPHRPADAAGCAPGTPPPHTVP